MGFSNTPVLQSPRPEVWAGLLGVVPREGCTLLTGNDGAYVHVLTFARNEEEYRTKVGAAMNHYCLDITEMEDVVPFSQLAASAELNALAEELESSHNMKHVRMLTLHKFPRIN